MDSSIDFSGIGEKYDLIAKWWDEQHRASDYGSAQVERALKYAPKAKSALDVGCSAGGRLTRKLEARGLDITGIDASSEMIKLARRHHPKARFIHCDIIKWETKDSFDFILAWDSLFHLPLRAQKPVLTKLCEMLNAGGILIYSFGDAIGEHSDQWRGQNFPYSSIGISENIAVLMKNKLSILHLERDQFPENHMYCIAIKERR